MQPLLLSSKSDYWAAPEEFFNRLDTAASDHNAKCKHYFTIEEDGFSKFWRKQSCRTVGHWMRKTYEKLGEWLATP